MWRKPHSQNDQPLFTVVSLVRENKAKNTVCSQAVYSAVVILAWLV
jgi:hypothetical protein